MKLIKKRAFAQDQSIIDSDAYAFFSGQQKITQAN